MTTRKFVDMPENMMIEKPDTPTLGDKGSYIRYMKYYWRDIVFIAVFFVSMWMMQLFNRPIGTVRNISIPFDDMIPLLPWTILVYMSWAPLIILLGIVFFFRDRALMRRYLLAMSVGQLLANLTFPFFQTIVPRPYDLVHNATDIFSKMLTVVYHVDNHYCGFPSIHVINCTVTMVMIWSFRQASWWMKTLVTLYFGFIAITTVTTKQHVFLDIPGGIFYGLVAIPLSIPLVRFYNRKIVGDAYR